ncbi:MAG: D-alanyl-D-alanine carboxypeptidase [Lachnospiraceae bacterium]|nr:D-alanyl-D-alanine carboxypeptidase [Lachnospiraceae bacterium]
MCIVADKKRSYLNKILNRAAAALLATALFCCSNASVMAQDGEVKKEQDLQLYAQAAVLMDADSGRVLYGKNEKDVLPMASTTKIMTCVLALEYGNPDDIVEASAYAATMPKVRLGVKQGERYRMGDLLYSLMLESHNDSAVVIAEAVGGSVEGFASMMNQKARDIGCYDTYFITPNGLDAVVNDSGKVHSTTAEDLAKIMAYCVTDSPAKELFLEITQTMSYDFTNAEGTRSFHCNNHNAFLSMMKEAISGKTGFTNSAGYCYVGAVESEGRIFTVALLACGWPNNRSYKWSDMKKLVTYGMERYEYRDIYEQREFQNIRVHNGIDAESGAPYKEAYVAVQIDDRGEQNIPYLLCEDDEVEIRVQISDVLWAPVAEHEEVGALSYYLNGTLVKRFPIITAAAVEERTYGFVCRYLLMIFLPR